MAFKIKDGGVWKDAAPSVKHSGAWKTPSEIFAKENGTWKSVWQSAIQVSWFIEVVPNPYKGFLEFEEDTSRSGGMAWLLTAGETIWPEMGFNLGNVPSGLTYQFKAVNHLGNSGWASTGRTALVSLTTSHLNAVDNGIRSLLINAGASAVLWNETQNIAVDTWDTNDVLTWVGPNDNPTWYAQDDDGSGGGTPLNYPNPPASGDKLTFTLTIPG